VLKWVHMAIKDDDIEHIYLDDEDQHPPKAPTARGGRAVESREEYKKFKRILIGILVVSSLLTFIRGVELNRFVADFMAVFFITFAAFKFIDIEGFAHAYRSYDPLASRIRPWGYIFPFFEAFMGFWYLLSEGPNNLNVLAIVVTGTALYGAFSEIKKASRFAHTYYDGFIKLPLARVGFIENATMLVLAVAMLFI
jgi:hypothetical protein